MFSDTSKKILNNTFYQFLGKFVSMSITVLATMIITRSYGREGYGAFNLMQSFPALFFIIVDFGLNAIAVKELTSDWSKAEKYLGNLILLRIFLAVLMMVTAGIGLLFFPYSDALKIGIAWGLFLILVQGLYTTTNIIFQTRFRYDLSTISYIVGSVLVLGLVLVFSYLKAPVMWVNFSYVLGGALTFLINLGFIKRLGVKINFSVDKELIKSLLIQSLPLGLMFVFSQINFKVDSILISVLHLPQQYGLSNTESVAIYGLPYKVFEVALVVPTFFMNSSYPVLIQHMLESKERLKKTFWRVLTFLFGVGVVAGLFGVLLAPLGIQILGGLEFGSSVLVLRILLGGIFVFFVSQPIAWLIVTLGGQKYLPIIYAIGAFFNVTANLLFIPLYSFYASSVITILSESLILVLLVFFARKVWLKKYA